ncbi:MAG: InlB B-repeat-containing protein [Roseburia sp.]
MEEIPLIFILIRACVHYALFEAEFYMKSKIETLKETPELFIMKYNPNINSQEEDSMKKRILSIVLALCLVAGMLPTVAYAYDNNGTIDSGEFNEEVLNRGTINGGTFNNTVTNLPQSYINNGTFNGIVNNSGGGRINGGTFNNTVNNISASDNILGGTFNGTVNNSAGARITDGTFYSTVNNNAPSYIYGGTFRDKVTNGYRITGGIFYGDVENNGTITGGTFYGTVSGTIEDSAKVTVTFDSDNGSTVREEKVLRGQKVTEPTAPAKADYSFEGWYNGDAKYDFTKAVTENITLTAWWKDIVNPVITGLENAKTYCYEQTVTVSDNIGIASVTVNGTLVPLDANNQFTLKPADVVQEVVATDNAGNKTTVTVTVNNGHTAANDDGDCVTPVYCIYHPDTVVVAAKSHNFSGEWNKDENGHRHTCQNGGCTVAETKTPHSGTDDGDCTTAVICKCGYTVTAANAKHSYGEWQLNGNGTHTRYCTIDGCNGYEDGKNSIEGKVTVIPKLPPEMLEGTGQSLTAGEKKELTFRSNAAFSDFIRVELDGKTLDEKNYTVKEGSTVVILKADYAATLSVGEHTIGIVSTSGTAATTFTVNAKAAVGNDTKFPQIAGNDTKSPQTEDNSMMWLWFVLLFVSGTGIAGVMVYSKRKRLNKT